MPGPENRFYESQDLRLHFVDWGNASAPPLFLIHGGRDHCRSWDRVARSLQPHFHVIAPDLRGHGDSDWTRGGSYALPEYLFDLTRLVNLVGAQKVALVGHSMGGMVSMAYAGAFPDHVSSLVVLDGVIAGPNMPKAPIEERIGRWISQLDALEAREPRRYATLAEAAAQMAKRNKRLAPELGLHLAQHGARRNDDGTYSWKFDPYQRAMAPHRLWPDEYFALWKRIACPALLLTAGDSAQRDPKATGVIDHFQNARAEIVADSGHWLHHDQFEDVIGLIRSFLGLEQTVGAA